MQMGPWFFGRGAFGLRFQLHGGTNIGVNERDNQEFLVTAGILRLKISWMGRGSSRGQKFERDPASNGDGDVGQERDLAQLTRLDKLAKPFDRHEQKTPQNRDGQANKSHKNSQKKPTEKTHRKSPEQKPHRKNPQKKSPRNKIISSHAARRQYYSGPPKEAEGKMEERTQCPNLPKNPPVSKHGERRERGDAPQEGRTEDIYGRGEEGGDAPGKKPNNEAIVGRKRRTREATVGRWEEARS